MPVSQVDPPRKEKSFLNKNSNLLVAFWLGNLSTWRVLLFTDSHCHLYSGQSGSVAVEAAMRNLSSVHSQVGEEVVGLACWVDPPGEGVGSRMEFLSDDSFLEHFSVSRQGLYVILASHRQPDRRLVLLPGRQLTTVERLEVLALGLTEDPLQKMDLGDTLSFVRDSGAIPVVAWGIGKWLGSRGSLLRDFLKQSNPKDFFLGDSALRPRLWGTPRHLSLATELGYKVLAGSDSLPLPGEDQRLLSYGTISAITRLEDISSLSQLKTHFEKVPQAIFGPRLPTLGTAQRWFQHRKVKNLQKGK